MISIKSISFRVFSITHQESYHPQAENMLLNHNWYKYKLCLGSYKVYHVIILGHIVRLWLKAKPINIKSWILSFFARQKFDLFLIFIVLLAS